MAVETLSLVGFNNLPVIRQSESAECGLACLAMVAWYYGKKYELNELRRKHATTSRGTDLSSLLGVAQSLDLGGRAVRCDLNELSKLRLPCILHYGFNHFVVLKRIGRRRCEIHDPAIGAVKIGNEELSRKFTGVALELTPTSNFKKRAPSNPLGFFEAVRISVLDYSIFSLGLLLALIAEALLVISPIFIQILIDSVLISGDSSILTALVIGFGFALFFQHASQLLKELTLQYLGQIISMDLSARIFSTILQLKASFFESRQLGDIQHRIMSISAIRDFLTSGAISIISDFIFISIMFVVILFYSMQLFLITALIFSMYILWRFLIFRSMKRAAGDMLIAEAEEQTHFLESLRTVRSIKLAGIESGREADWRNKMVRRVNAHIRTGNLNIAEAGVSGLIIEGGKIGSLAFAATQTLNSEMSIGMLSAFAAYFGLLSVRLRSVVDLYIRFLIMKVPLNRLADIAFGEKEFQGDNGGRVPRLDGSVGIKNVSFRYGPLEPFVLNQASFEARPSEFVAIVGKSGAGKSTVLRLLTGLESVSSGQVLYNDRPIESWCLKTLRSQIAVILQDDCLMRGSLAENISSFDEKYDGDRIKRAASMASIAEEIEAMPMGYETQVGDLGVSLSGGQIQRVILARALYRNPRILILDEATSHLDPENESKILTSIKQLEITRIVIAHRRETVEQADRVFEVVNGRLIDQSQKVTDDEKERMIAATSEFLSQYNKKNAE